MRTAPYTLTYADGAPRRAEVEVQGLRVSDDGRVENVLSDPRIAPPGTHLHFVAKSGRYDYVVGKDQLGPAFLKLRLQAGDSIDVLVNDKKSKWARLTVDGAPVRDGDEVPAGLVAVNGISATDPQQGDLGDCWWMAGLSAIAHASPERLAKGIVTHADGSHTVKLKRFDHDKGKFVSDARHLPVHFTAKGRATNAKERWPQLYEAAYAQTKGSFAAVAVGYPFAVFEAVLGKRGWHVPFDRSTPAEIWDCLSAANTRPTVCVSKTGRGRNFSGNGLVPDHAYTVLGTLQRRGERLVKLRNPWAQYEPKGNGRDDGVFELPIDVFLKFFAYACYC